MVIKLCIFDMGGVVAHNAAISKAIASRLEISEDDFFVLAKHRDSQRQGK